MLAARWNAHALNAPGKFLVSAPEHERPNRARAYLITDEAVSDTAARHAATRPDLDPISRHAIEARPHPAATEPSATSTHPDWPDDAASDPGPDSGTALHSGKH